MYELGVSSLVGSPHCLSLCYIYIYIHTCMDVYLFSRLHKHPTKDDIGVASNSRLPTFLIFVYIYIYLCIYAFVYIYIHIHIYERTHPTNDDVRGASIRGSPQCLYISVYMTICACICLWDWTYTQQQRTWMLLPQNAYTHIYIYIFPQIAYIYIHILQIIRLFDVFYFIHKYMYINIHILQTIISFHVFFGLHFCLFRFEYPTSRFNGILVRQDHVWNMSITTCRYATILIFPLVRLNTHRPVFLPFFFTIFE